MKVTPISDQNQLVWDYTCGAAGSEVLYLHPSYVHRACVPDGPANSEQFEEAVINQVRRGRGYGVCKFCGMDIVPTFIDRKPKPTEPTECNHFL